MSRSVKNACNIGAISVMAAPPTTRCPAGRRPAQAVPGPLTGTSRWTPARGDPDRSTATESWTARPRLRDTSRAGCEPRRYACYVEFAISGIRWTAGLCALLAWFCWWGLRRWCFRPHNPGGRCYRVSESSQQSERRGLARSAAGRCAHRRRIACLFIPLPDAEVILVGEADVRVSVSRVLAVLRGAGRAEGTVRRQQVVLDRFAAFLAGRGLDTASDRVCIDFIANQTGVRLGSLREPVEDRAVRAVRRPVVLMADVLAGRAVEVDRAVVPAKDGCPAKFRPLRDGYLASCRRRGNAGATVVAKDRAASRFLGYLDEVGVDDLAALNVRDVSGFLLRQRGLRRKTIAAMRSCLA